MQRREHRIASEKSISKLFRGIDDEMKAVRAPNKTAYRLDSRFRGNDKNPVVPA